MRCSRSFAIARIGRRLVFSALLVLAVHGAPKLRFIQWVVSPFQPDIPVGGRADTLAVHPQYDNSMLVASSTGGLFGTTDRGQHWKHVDTLKASGNAVAYWPKNPLIVIATARSDFHTSNYGGIWRSTNGGGAWAQIPITGLPANPSLALSAGEVSIAPDSGAIYVATNYGVAVSADGGASFQNTTPFATGNPEVLAILALPGNVVLAGGLQGVRRSGNSGADWPTLATNIGKIVDMHAFGRSALSPDQAYLVNELTELYVTENAGQSWQKIPSTPLLGADSAAGGIAFARTSRGAAQPGLGAALDLYYSNRLDLFRLRCPQIAGTNRFDYSGAWVKLAVDHPDIRDIAFDASQQPLLVGGDGGLFSTSDGGASWKYVGGGANGFNALQITEIRGQWIQDIGRYHLYFGTQDNGFWSSDDGGQKWSSWGNEGAGIEAWRRVDTAAQSWITVDDTGSGNVWFGGPCLTGMQVWHYPPERTRSSLVEAPKLIAPSTYIQAVNDSMIVIKEPPKPPHPIKNFGKGYVITRDLGAKWYQYAEFPEAPRDLPKLSMNGDNPPQPVLYQAIRTGLLLWFKPVELNLLARITMDPSGNWGKVEYPSMSKFGGLGFNNTMFAWYQVFGVDPANPSYLIAPDVVNDKMMISADGGNSWSENPQLTALVTDNGTFQFKRDGNIPQASVISFFPDDPNLIAIGTWQTGILLSSDHGATWDRIPDSEPLTHITSIEWRSAGEMIVSTYGRGLWQVAAKVVGPKQPFPEYCRGCKVGPPAGRLVDPVRPAASVAFANAVLVLDGKVQGFRTAGRSLELFVWPGSSVRILSDERVPPAIKVTETTRWMGIAGSPVNWPEPGARDARMVGLFLGRRGEVSHVVFAPQSITARQNIRQVLPEASSVSPTKGKPYLRLGAAGGQNVFFPGEEIAVAGTGFSRGGALEILMDGVLASRTSAAQDGTLSARLRAPRDQGAHTVVVRPAGNERPLDGASLLVKSRDR